MRNRAFIKNINIIGCILLLSLFYCCADHTSISFCCEKDKAGNYIIKWEVFPEKDNAKIDIYSSDNDTIFPKSPVKTKLVNDYVAVIEPTDGTFREFFKLKTGKCSSGVITNRSFNVDSLQNLRDIGGHFTKFGKQMRWGKAYRSGALARISEEDKNTLKSLGIKTVIDFRDVRQVKNHPDTYSAENYIHLPIDVYSFNSEIKAKIVDGSFLKGDAIIHTQDCYRSIIEDHSQQYKAFFNILCNEENYPLIYHCGLGKDKTGLATFFLLKTLDMPDEIIEDDFLLSNDGINKFLLLREGTLMPEQMQEAMTTISKADISQLKYAVSCMKRKSGSVDNYMIKELDITPQKKEKLKSILLYQ